MIIALSGLWLLEHSPAEVWTLAMWPALQRYKNEADLRKVGAVGALANAFGLMGYVTGGVQRGVSTLVRSGTAAYK